MICIILFLDVSNLNYYACCNIYVRICFNNINIKNTIIFLTRKMEKGI